MAASCRTARLATPFCTPSALCGGKAFFTTADRQAHRHGLLGRLASGRKTRASSATPLGPPRTSAPVLSPFGVVGDVKWWVGAAWKKITGVRNILLSPGGYVPICVFFMRGGARIFEHLSSSFWQGIEAQTGYLPRAEDGLVGECVGDAWVVNLD